MKSAPSYWTGWRLDQIMLDKSDYYHGAAIIRLMDDGRCWSVRKLQQLGYIVNDEVFIFLKYTTKSRTPWGFTFDQEDVERCLKMATEYHNVILGFICGGDGVCALHWCEAKELLGGKAGRIAAGRKHNHSYSVWGTCGELKQKIPVGRWLSLAFESNNQLFYKIGKL